MTRHSVIVPVFNGERHIGEALASALPQLAADDEVEYKTYAQLDKAIAKVKREMEKAAKELDFMEAARLRDKMFGLQKILDDLK